LMDGQVKEESWEEMEGWVQKQAKPLKQIRALGTGGNISKLYRMSGAQQKDEYMHIDQLKGLLSKIEALPIKERIYQLRLNPDRADVIEHAALIYLKIMQWAGVDEIITPQAGLKEGLILEIFTKVNSQKK
jgi:exopolyphosphatase/guanosine-5'-triphosphate,3'-diphosphate pyrophosphatase